MNLDNIQRQLDEGHPIDPADIQALVRFARERQWVSVEERLPGEDGLYLAHHNEVVFEVIYEDGSFYVPTFNSRVKGFSTIVTHWQYLPEPPSDD